MTHNDNQADLIGAHLSDNPRAYMGLCNKQGACVHILHMLWLLAWCFVRFQTVGVGVIFDFFACFGTHFLLLDGLTQP